MTWLLLRWRFAWIALACVAFTTVRLPGLAPSMDWTLFEFAARVLLHRPGYTVPGGFLHSYVYTPLLQVGPPALLATVPTQLVKPLEGQALAALMMMLLLPVCLLGLERAALVMGARPARVPAMTAAVGLALVPVWSSVAVTWLHLDDALAITGVCLAVPALLRQRWLIGGMLLGTAIAAKPWAIVVLPLILALRREDRPKALLATMACGGLWWAPFLLAAPGTVHAVGSVRLATRPSTLWHQLGFGYPPVGFRELQFGVGMGGAWLAARRGNWLAVPLIGFAIRVVLDPGSFSYYGDAPVIAALAADLAGSRRAPWWTAAAVAAYFGVPQLAHPIVTVLAAIAFAAAATWWFSRPAAAAVPVQRSCAERASGWLRTSAAKRLAEPSEVSS